MAGNSDNGNKRVSISASSEIRYYLEELAELGIHGKTPTEVAKSLISNEIERLIKDGILKIKRKNG